MTRWMPQKQDVLGAFATEVTAVYPARATVAIIAADPAESSAFGRDVADAVAATGRAVRVSDSVEVDPDGVTVVVGPVAADENNWTRWNVPVWLDHDRDEDGAMRRRAGVVFDLTDPKHPRRRFADSC